MMCRKYITLIGFCFFILSCSSTQKGLFVKRTPHEKYADKLAGAGLVQTTLGSKWLAAATKGIQQPLNIALPYKEAGYFSDIMPDAAGFRFNARHGEQVNILVETKPAGSIVFADVWIQTEQGTLSFLQSADTTGNTLQFEATKDALYQLRIQPQLLAGVSYTLTINTTPSLAFPVPSDANPKIGSFWGASRDAGARSHEGIDIFGRFRTPVVAAANGVVTSTRNNNLGGKVVFMRPDNKNYSLYYAHLDSQMVSAGDRVTAGDVLGLMGNTGNAKNTPTHLHFGIYTNSGAVDPLPFVNNNRPAPETIKASLTLVDSLVRNSRDALMYATPSAKDGAGSKIPRNTLMKITAATGAWYKVKMMESGKEGFVRSDAVSLLARPIRTIAVSNMATVFDIPDTTAAIKFVLQDKREVAVLAESGNFLFVAQDAGNGWMARPVKK